MQIPFRLVDPNISRIARNVETALRERTVTVPEGAPGTPEAQAHKAQERALAAQEQRVTEARDIVRRAAQGDYAFYPSHETSRGSAHGVDPIPADEMVHFQPNQVRVASPDGAEMPVFQLNKEQLAAFRALRSSNAWVGDSNLLSKVEDDAERISRMMGRRDAMQARLEADRLIAAATLGGPAPRRAPVPPAATVEHAGETAKAAPEVSARPEPGVSTSPTAEPQASAVVSAEPAPASTGVEPTSPSAEPQPSAVVPASAEPAPASTGVEPAPRRELQPRASTALAVPQRDPLSTRSTSVEVREMDSSVKPSDAQPAAPASKEPNANFRRAAAVTAAVGFGVGVPVALTYSDE